ncbi:MAG: hypothetical protein KJO60_10870 [Desulfofustis sp.]|nr:hypothetical protein [Desulfofustis sp.]MBT8355016.1 hypothetical protein [Desulfofustis sp.]NNK57089.1 hypothetical protein [Desulfofustis sp.]
MKRILITITILTVVFPVFGQDATTMVDKMNMVHSLEPEIIQGLKKYSGLDERESMVAARCIVRSAPFVVTSDTTLVEFEKDLDAILKEAAERCSFYRGLFRKIEAEL